MWQFHKQNPYPSDEGFFVRQVPELFNQTLSSVLHYDYCLLMKYLLIFAVGICSGRTLGQHCSMLNVGLLLYVLSPGGLDIG